MAAAHLAGTGDSSCGTRLESASRGA